MKKILLVIALLGLVSYNYSFADCNKKVMDRVIRHVSGGNGAWWNPFDSGWENIDTDKITFDDGTTQSTISCTGNGSLDCPTTCSFSSGGDPENHYDREHNGDPIHDAHIDHLLYVESQAALGIYSGEETFPDVITETGTLHSYVSWNGNANGADIDSQLYICE